MSLMKDLLISKSSSEPYCVDNAVHDIGAEHPRKVGLERTSQDRIIQTLPQTIILGKYFSSI